MSQRHSFVLPTLNTGFLLACLMSLNALVQAESPKISDAPEPSPSALPNVTTTLSILEKTGSTIGIIAGSVAGLMLIVVAIHMINKRCHRAPILAVSSDSSDSDSSSNSIASNRYSSFNSTTPNQLERGESKKSEVASSVSSLSHS